MIFASFSSNATPLLFFRVQDFVITILLQSFAYNRYNNFVHWGQEGYRPVLLGLSVFSFLGIIFLLVKSVAKYLCVAVSCLSWKFAIWSLTRAFQFSNVVGPVVTSFSVTGLHSILGFWWHCCWFTRLLHCVDLFSLYFFQKFLFLFCWCIFHIGILSAWKGCRISCSIFWTFVFFFYNTGFGSSFVQTIVASLLILFIEALE